LKCGKEFLARPYKVREGKGKFCSQACGASYNHLGKPKPKSRLNIIKANEARVGLPPWNKLPLIDLTCKQCGQLFQVNNPRRNTAHFCSRHCHNLYKKTITGLEHPLYTRQPRNCEWCGKEVWVKPAKLQEFRFCSRQCLGSWVSRHQHHPSAPEIIVSDALRELSFQFVSEYRIGRYSCDFVIPSHKIVIEVDGTYWHSKPKRKQLDKIKDDFLSKQGWVVIRFKEKDIYQNLTKCLIKLNKYIPLIQTTGSATQRQFV